MWVRPLGGEDPLEEEMATHSSILAWRIPWPESKFLNDVIFLPDPERNPESSLQTEEKA